jgi:hypothetical protein
MAHGIACWVTKARDKQYDNCCASMATVGTRRGLIVTFVHTFPVLLAYVYFLTDTPSYHLIGLYSVKVELSVKANKQHCLSASVDNSNYV